jgi:hypothetical protein
LPITSLAGLGLALSTSLVLFTSSLLITEFSQITDPWRGAVFGSLLWAAYWVLLVWFSVTRLAGVASGVMGTAIASSRQLLSALRQLLRPAQSETSQPDQTLLRELAAEVSQLADLQRQLPDLLTHQRDTLIAEIVERTNLSPMEAESVVSELEPKSSSLGQNLSAANSQGLLNQLGLDLPSWQQLVRQLLSQVDLSDLDVATLWQQVQSLRGEESKEVSPRVQGIVLDARDYIIQTPVWCLQPEAIEQEFYERIYDPKAAAEPIREQVSQLTRADFLEWLQQRQDLAQDQIENIADHLSQVQNSVLERVSYPPAPTATYPSQALQAMADKLLAYCRYTNLDVLTAKSVTEKVEALRQEFEVPLDAPLATQPQLDVAPLSDVLSRRQGMSEPQAEALTQALVKALGDEPSHPENESSYPEDEPSPQESDDAWLERANHRLTDYFHSIDWSAVSLEDIKPEVIGQLQSLDLKGELDWQSLRAHLQVPEELKDDLFGWLPTVGAVMRQPRRWADRVGESTQSFAQYLIRQITHYLKFQDKAAFRPDQIAEDLTTILKNAVELLPDPSDWEILSDLKQLIDPRLLQETLENRRDMTADQIQAVLGWFENAWQIVTRQVLDWTQTLWAETQAWLSTRSDNLDEARQSLVNRIADVQQDLQDRAAQVKADLQSQADAVRRQVAIAAAWLFFSLLSSAGAAMAAGWLGVHYF